jgi:hypothetical protein
MIFSLKPTEVPLLSSAAWETSIFDLIKHTTAALPDSLSVETLIINSVTFFFFNNLSLYGEGEKKSSECNPLA